MNTVFRPLMGYFLAITGILSFQVFPALSQNKYALQPDIWKNETRSVSTKQPEALPWYSSYDVVFTKLDLHLERNTVYVDGNVITNARSNVQGLANYRCELVSSLMIDSVKFNGQLANVLHTVDTVIVTLNPAVNQEEMFSIQIFYHGMPPTGGFFAGITTAVSTSWGNEVTWTLSEPFNAYQWWPCKQDLADKYDSSWFFITTDSSNKAGSNGLLTAVTSLPGGKKRYEWKERYPIDYYLISAAVADYQEYDNYAHPAGSADSLLIQHYIYDAPGCLAFYKNDLDLTPYFLDLYSQLFGPYPFVREKYGHCQTNLGGCMEHQTMGTVGAFNFHLNCHELSHQWFGDHVTCATWSDIWVNEGFATYAQYLALQYLVSQAYADSMMMGVHSYVMTAPDGSVYIPPSQTNDEARIFNGRLSYNKGGAIIQSLRGEINNDTLFFNVLKTYMNTYADSVATGVDFKHIAENITGTNFDDFFNQWYFGEGYPIFDISYWQSGDSLFIGLNQTTSSPITPLYKMHLEFKVSTIQGDTIIRIFQETANQVFSIHMPQPILGITVDPHNWNTYKLNSLSRIGDGDPIDGEVLLYPNPWTNKIHYLILLPDPGPFEAVIYDVHGKELKKFRMTFYAGSFDTEDLSAGPYVIKIAGKNFSLTRKVVKQ